MNDSVRLPDGLPSIATARLPETYEAAKTALTECTRIDECQNWSNQAEAMASYAKMANDDGLRRMADRIQARAIRRCGELLKVFNGRGNNQHSGGAPTMRQAAADAGLSKDQQNTAVRVANIPEPDFNAQVESDSPPTVTALAEQGKKGRVIDLTEGRDHEEYSMATQAQGRLQQFAEFAGKVDPAAVARGSKPHETHEMRRQIAVIDGWLDALITRLET